MLSSADRQLIRRAQGVVSSILGDEGVERHEPRAVFQPLEPGGHQLREPSSPAERHSVGMKMRRHRCGASAEQTARPPSRRLSCPGCGLSFIPTGRELKFLIISRLRELPLKYDGRLELMRRLYPEHTDTRGAATSKGRAGVRAARRRAGIDSQEDDAGSER